MDEFINNIKKAILASIKAMNLCDVIYGTVTNISPLKIRINQQLEITQEFLVVSDMFSILKGNTTQGQSVTIDNRLKLGDKVILIRRAGGQQYVVEGRVKK